MWIGRVQPRAEKGCNILMTALQAYVCWRIAAGAVGWAVLLLGLATDRLGATNAVALAIHVTAVSTARECIFYCSIAALSRASQASLAWGVETRTTGSRTVVFSTVSCRRGVMLSPMGLWAGAWTPADGARGDAATSANSRKSDQGGAFLNVSCARRRVGPAERCFA